MISRASSFVKRVTINEMNYFFLFIVNGFNCRIVGPQNSSHFSMYSVLTVAEELRNKMKALRTYIPAFLIFIIIILSLSSSSARK
jgi:hypothetical protein